MREKFYAPFWKDLNFRWYPDGEAMRVREVVGIAVERDKHGYATRITQSDGVSWTMPQDLEAFLYTPDPRLLFVDGVNREVEPILKYLGADVNRKLLDGFEVDKVTYRGGVLRVRKCKSIWSLKPFYTTNLLPEDSDCYGVQARGERLVKAISDVNLPLRLHSPGSMLEHLPYMSAPDDVAEMAYNCYHGGWIEAMKLGFWKQAYDYDLSSAYPTEAAGLLSCSEDCGYWVHSSTYVSDAFYGFCYCKIRMDISIPLSPIMVRVRSLMSHSGRWPIRTVRNPVGVWEGWMTKEEIEFIVTNWLGDIEVLDGYWFIPTRYHQPFMPMVGKLRQVRTWGERGGDELIRNLGKLPSAAIQGKMMQSYVANGKRVVGNAFNPVYAAALTARVRVKVAEIALENCDDILMVMVDGLLASHPLAVPKQWKLAHTGECIVANHGDYSIAGRDVVSKLRQSLEESLYELSYRMYAPRYESISECMDADSFDLACMRKPEMRSRVSKVGKRYWETLPKVCEDLLVNQYESNPMMVTEGLRVETNPLTTEDIDASLNRIMHRNASTGG